MLFVLFQQKTVKDFMWEKTFYGFRKVEVSETWKAVVRTSEKLLLSLLYENNDRNKVSNT